MGYNTLMRMLIRNQKYKFKIRNEIVEMEFAGGINFSGMIMIGDKLYKCRRNGRKDRKFDFRLIEL